MYFVGWNEMTLRPSSVVRTETSIAAPLLHRIRQNVLHALVAVKLDDLFYRTLFQMHPIEVFPNENIDSARTGTILAEAFAPFFDLAALACGFGIVGIN